MVHPADANVSRTLSGSARLGPVFTSGETIGGVAAQMAAPSALRSSAARPGVPGFRDWFRPHSLADRRPDHDQGIKLAVGRTRPDGTQFSFPSGHSASSFATATVLQRNLGWKAGVPAYAMATFVAASRVQVKRHYLSDVTMGAAIGIIAGRSVTVGRGDARFAVAPSALPAAPASTSAGSGGSSRAQAPGPRLRAPVFSLFLRRSAHGIWHGLVAGAPLAAGGALVRPPSCGASVP